MELRLIEWNWRCFQFRRLELEFRELCRQVELAGNPTERPFLIQKMRVIAAKARKLSGKPNKPANVIEFDRNRPASSSASCA
jgi:hypothetical protein